MKLEVSKSILAVSMFAAASQGSYLALARGQGRDVGQHPNLRHRIQEKVISRTLGRLSSQKNTPSSSSYLALRGVSSIFHLLYSHRFP